MSSLRRDLIERRLWPIAVVLIAAIVAVPFLLAGHSHKSQAALAAAAAPVQAASSSSTAASATTTGAGTTATGSHGSKGSGSRNPFGGGGGSSSATSTSTTAASSGGSSTGSATASTNSAGAGPTASAGATGSTGAAGSPAGGSTATSPTPATTTTTTTTTAASTTRQGKTTSETITAYAVDIRFTPPGRGSTSIANVARFTPLPAANWPRVMFMGVTSGGNDAVFALGAGVLASGNGTCHPRHDQCTLVSLPVGHTEQVSWPYHADQRRTMRLAVSHITKRTITGRNAIEVATQRHSLIGLCELELGNPIQYLYSHSGQLRSVSNPTPDCTKAMKKVALAFPGTTSEYGAVAVPGTNSDDAPAVLPGLITEEQG